MTEPSLTILNHYVLLAPAPRFEEAIGRLVARVRRDGHPGILSYRFFVNANEKTARAVIDYRDPAAWIGHHDIAMIGPK